MLVANFMFKNMIWKYSRTSFFCLLRRTFLVQAYLPVMMPVISWNNISWGFLDSQVHIYTVLEYFLGEGSGTPLQYSCLENLMDGRSLEAAVHGVVKSRTWLSAFTFTFHFNALEKKNGNPLQCSCLENPRNAGAWWAAVYGVTQSQTQLKRLSSSSSSSSSSSRVFPGGVGVSSLFGFTWQEWSVVNTDYFHMNKCLRDFTVFVLF